MQAPAALWPASSGKKGRVRPIPFFVFAVTFVATLTIRVWNIGRHFWLLEDQIRDWSIALRPLTDLPLVGPPTHVHGYTIGPAYYWLLWAIRVGVGPWFHNLPHAGGIGQAILQSAADVLLLAAIWRRTNSVWIAWLAIVILATAPEDLSVAAIVWNPTAGSALAKAATALVLLGWPDRSRAGAAITTAIMWCGVQSYTGAIFVAVGVFTALLASPFARRDWIALRHTAAIMVAVVTALQLPYVIHQLMTRFNDPAMSAVTGSIGQVLAGNQSLQFGASWSGFTAAFRSIEMAPLRGSWVLWLLAACNIIVASRFRRDPIVLSVSLLPQAAALLGYAFYVGDFLDHYYYLSLMPAAVLTMVLALTAVRPLRVRQFVTISLLIGALALAPARMRIAATQEHMPEYGLLVDGSKALARLQQPMRAVQTEFALPPTSNPEFIYQILGGRIDRSARMIGLIRPDGTAYQR